jgi:hypothetical protein
VIDEMIYDKVSAPCYLHVEPVPEEAEVWVCVYDKGSTSDEPAVAFLSPEQARRLRDALTDAINAVDPPAPPQPAHSVAGLSENRVAATAGCTCGERFTRSTPEAAVNRLALHIQGTRP